MMLSVPHLVSGVRKNTVTFDVTVLSLTYPPRCPAAKGPPGPARSSSKQLCLAGGSSACTR